MAKNTKVVCCSVSKEFHELCKAYDISFSEALRVGISIVLADIGVREYDNNLNSVKKMRFFVARSEELSKQIEEMKTKLEGFEK